MKNFTRKFFLLTIGMILSVGAYAQDEITHHWPELRFTIVNADGTPTDGVTYHIPGWDAWHRFPKGNSFYVYSHLRVQKYEKTGVDEETGKDVFKARLVTRYIVSPDNRLTVPTLEKAASAAPIYVKFEEQDYLKEDLGVKNIRGLQYKDIFETTYNGEHNVGPDGTNYDVDIIDELIDDKIIISGTLEIPAQMTHAATGEIYNLDEIGDYALRQYARTSQNRSKNYVQASKIIIPKEIKSIGRGAFFTNYHTKEIVFEEGSSIKVIPEFNFQNYTSLEIITFPSSLETLTGTVLGGCPALKRITFASENPPTLEAFTWNGVERKVFETTTSSTSPTVPEKCIIEVPLHAAKKYVDSNDKFKEFPMSSKFPMAYDMITYCSDLEFTFKQYDTSSKTWSDGSLKAYYAEFDGLSSGKVTMTEITESKKIPSTDFGVLLKGTQNETYDIFYPNNLIDGNISFRENCLKGVVTATDIDPNDPEAGGGAFYVLSTDGKFHRVKKAGKLGANKAYLFDETGGPENIGTTGNTMSVTLPGDETGIEILLVEDEADDAVYTLQGTKVSQSHKGLVIQNGKKYIVR